MIVFTEEPALFCGCDQCVRRGKTCKYENCKHYDDVGEDYTCSKSYEATVKAFYERKSVVVTENDVIIDGNVYSKEKFITLAIFSGKRTRTLIEEGEFI